MNRRDFETLARGFKFARPRPGAPDETMIWARTTITVADGIAGSEGNHGFDREKFLKQCGVPNAEQR